MKSHTWVEAIRKVLEDNGGAATIQLLYQNIGKYRDYSGYKRESDWQAALRGHLYREINNNRNFKKIGFAIYALKDYEEEPKPEKEDKERIHSYIQGICLELGNLEGLATYTAHSAAVFKDNIKLGELARIKQLPEFTYPEILREIRRIDVIWFNQRGLMFPQKVFEVVHSLGTLTEALNRSALLVPFQTTVLILGPKEHEPKFSQKIELAPYVNFKEKYRFKDYDEVIAYYENAVRYTKLREKFI